MNIIDASLKVLRKDISYYGELIFLTKFGSYLYGLSTLKSDIDILGIYISYPDKVLKGEIKRYFEFSSKEEQEKAKFWDFEIYIYNFFDFIKKLNSGDIKALNLFFSYTNQGALIHYPKSYKNILNILLKEKRLYINKNLISYLDYIIYELKRFGVRGSFEGSLNFLISFLEKYKDKKLKDIKDILKLKIKSYEENKIKFLEDRLFFFGKYFLYTFKNTYILDILAKLKQELEEKKQRKIENLQKRIYHAKRALYELNMILRYGKIIYPFKGKRLEKLKVLKESKNINVKKEISYILKEAEKIKSKVKKLPEPLNINELLKLSDKVYKNYFNFPLLSYTKHFL